MRRRSALILMLEPFVLAVVGVAALFYFLSALVRHAGGGGRPLSAARALQLCAVPCLAVVLLAPWLGPAALVGYFGVSLVAILRLK